MLLEMKTYSQDEFRHRTTRDYGRESSKKTYDTMIKLATKLIMAERVRNSDLQLFSENLSRVYSDN